MVQGAACFGAWGAADAWLASAAFGDQLQPQLGSTAQPHEGSQPQLGSQQLTSQQQAARQHLRAAILAFKRANRPGLQQQGSQHESQQQSSAQPHEGSHASAQPQAGSAAQPHDGSQASAQPQLGSAAQPHEGSQHESQQSQQSQQACFILRQARLQQSLMRLHSLCLRQQGSQQGSQQHEASQPQLGSAQPQLGSHAIAQPQLGSQPQPPSMPKNAEAFPALDSAMATPSVDSR